MFGRKKRTRNIIKMNFGKDPREGSIFYDASERMRNVSRYHVLAKKNSLVVDDITWDDLEMDQVFLRINHTNSFIGEQVLYHQLHNLNQEEDEDHEDFEQKLNCLSQNLERRVELEARLREIGKNEDSYYLWEFLHHAKLWVVGHSFFYHVMQALLVFFLISSILTDENWMTLGLFAVAGCNFMLYFRAKNQYEIHLDSLGVLRQIYDLSRWIKKDQVLGPVFVREEEMQAIDSLKGMSRLITNISIRKESSLSGDVAAMFMDYFWGITLIDVSMVNHLMKVIEHKQEEVQCLMNLVGEIDSKIGVLSFRTSLDSWCIPEYVQEGIAVEGLVHPLLDSPIKNDWCLRDKAIITGSNASGKSTFMKAIGINCIMAQTIHTSTATKMSLESVFIMTCMSLRDDIISGESYYFREAKYLKRMLDQVGQKEDERKTLCIIDEILKGTNTKERISASKAILEFIGSKNCLAIVATHDNELTHNEAYENYHFRSMIKNNDIKFDYQIQEGSSQETNAIALLSILGYSKDIIEAAKENLNENW